MFFGINLCKIFAFNYDKKKIIINSWAIGTPKFMKKKCSFSMIFFGIIKNYMVFSINLCIFFALIYDTK